MENPTAEVTRTGTHPEAPYLNEKANQEELYTLPDKGLTERLQAITGGYLTEVDKIVRVMNDRYIGLVYENVALKQKIEQLAGYEQENMALAKRLEELTLTKTAPTDPDAEYKINFYNEFLSSEGTYTSGQIANQFGKTAVWLNKWLISIGVLHKEGRYLYPTRQYIKMGLTVGKIFLADANDVVRHAKVSMAWTAKGYEFVCNLLKKHGVKRNGSV